MRSFLSAISLSILFAAPQAWADWQYDYYEFSGSWSVLPADFDALTPVVSSSSPTIDIGVRLRDDQFAFRFRNQFEVTIPGNYQFSTTSDDGSQLLVDGALVVDNDGLHGSVTVSGSVFLTAGIHQFEVTHFEQGGGQVLSAAYAPPGGGFRAFPASGALDGPDVLSDTGAWGPVIQWPHVPVSAANMPDGRILTWASNEKYSFPGGRPEFTFTAIWDPVASTLTEIDHPSHDMFCAHQVMLEDGKVFVSGGRNSGQSPWTSVFDLATDSWVPLNNMNRGRWYPTSLALGDGSVFTAIGSGGGNTGEWYDPETGTWTLKSGLNFNSNPKILDYSAGSYGERNWWPLFALTPNGDIFHAGPTPQTHLISLVGQGSTIEQYDNAEPPNPIPMPTITEWYPKHGTTIMYDEGKLLTAGGWENGASILSTNKSITIDISQPVPVISSAQPMIHKRKFHNGVMLPNGEVLVIGGNTSGQKFNDTGTVYEPEIWNPTSGQWRSLAPMSVPRNYHSIALLLTDGTVLSAGGGLCNCSADHADGQIFYPPYLYNPDGSLKPRPSITLAPAAIRAGDVFDVQTDEDIPQFSLIKMSSTTHAVNTDLRYLDVPRTGSAGNYQLTAHSNPNVLTPGYWMLFALNADGTPSVAKVIQVRAENPEIPSSTLNLDFASLADTGSFQLNGAAASIGGSLRLSSTVSNTVGSAYHNTPVSIDSTTSFTSSFAFSLGGGAGGSEGLAFVIQGNEITEIGSGGGGLGYQDVPNSLVVEIDTADTAPGDPSGNHIAVHTGGDSQTPLASAFAPFDLNNGVSHRIWIDFESLTNTLEIYLANDSAASKPVSPILSLGDFSLLEAVGSLGYFGFSGASGAVGNNHDVQSWNLLVTVGNQPLVVSELSSPPQSSDGPVNFSATATGEGLMYSWSFGDGSAQTPFSSSPDISHVYSSPGRYVVTLIVEDINGAQQQTDFVQAVYPALTPNKPASSSTILVESVTGIERVWVVNPDNNTVSVVNGLTHAKIAEIPVGADPRALAKAPDNTIWVANKDSASITIVDATTLSVAGSRALPAGSRPHGLVMDQIGGFAYVALEAIEQVWKLDVYSDTVLSTADVGSSPRHLSLTGDGGKLFISRFITPPLPDEHTLNPQTSDVSGDRGGEVVVLDPATMGSPRTVVLHHSDNEPAEITGPGFPNYLGPAIISPGGLLAYVPSKQDNVLRGLSRNGDPLNHEHTVRAVTSIIDVINEIEDFENLGNRIDHDNASIARNGAFGPYGIYLFVALEGNRQIAVVDAFGFEEIFRFNTGFAPQSVATSEDGNRVYVHNFLSRSVSILNASSLINGMSDSLTLSATVPLVQSEALSPQVLQGKKLFYDAADPRLAKESYMACASCHNDGGHDGRVWDISSMGEGIRNTISLKGHGGMAHGPLHWTGNFDEVQDFENQIRDLAGGTGLLTAGQFAATQDILGAPKTGLSSDLDALAAYVESLSGTELSPYRLASGALTADGELGKALFDATGCAGCHQRNRFTDSAMDNRHDIGTITTASGQRLGAVLDGFDTPTMKGLWASAPYLHDGSAQTLRDAILAHDSAALGGATLSDTELQQLTAYLLQIDDREFDAQIQTWSNQDIGAVGAAGTFSENAGTLTINASGADVWGTKDEFHFAYQALDGDGEIIARVVSLQNTNNYAKAGVMLRAGLTESSAHSMMIVTAARGAALQYRQTAGSLSAPSGTLDSITTAPTWVRLVREGNLFSGYVSSDGISWVLKDQVTMAMPATVYAGLMTTSHNDGVLTTAVFDNVSLIPAVPPVPDTTPPSIPANVQAVAAGTTSIDVSWDASIDAESSVGGYQVFRDGVQVGTTATLSYQDIGLTPSSSYLYTVAAFDTASPANYSLQSSPAVLGTTDDEVFVAVPNVVSQQQSAAELSITTAGLTVGVITTATSATVPAGNVISQNPSAGTMVVEESAVDLAISLGAAPVTVPDVSGQSLSAATTTLNGLGLNVGSVSRVTSSTIPPDDVISQNPLAGIEVPDGSTIDLIVSDGPDLTPPSVPAGLQAIPAGPNRIDLSWVPSIDAASGVAGYRVFQDGSPVGTTLGTSFNALGLSANTTYSFTVAAFDGSPAANESDQSSPVEATTGPAPIWTSQDIGAVGAAGTFSENAGTLTINASGADVWGTKDEFHFAYQALDGDGEIIARVVSLQNTNNYAKAGVMLRAGLTESSAHSMMIVTAARGAALQYRQTAGSLSAPSGTLDSITTAPTWVRLVREGNLFSGYVSSDGISWVLKDQVTMAMPATVYAGLMTTSHNDGVLTTAVFDNVSLIPAVPPVPDTTPPSIPANVQAVAAGTTSIDVSWDASIDAESSVGGYQVFRDGVQVGTTATLSYQDIGLTPSSSYLYTVAAFDTASPANYSLQSSPAVLGTTDDEVFVAVPNVVSQQQSAAELSITTAGLTVGVITTATSATVPAGNVISQNPSAGTMVVEESAVDLAISLGAAPVTVPDVSGQSLSAATTTLNDAGLLVGTVTRATHSTIPVDEVMDQTPQAGIEVPHGSPVDLVVSDGPPLWTNQDIGSVAAAGTFSESAGTLTINASGADVWGTADEFHFAYQTLSGDGEIIARVVSLDNTNNWAKAGAMLRTSLTANSAHAMMIVSAANGADLQYRQTTGGATAPSRSSDGVTTAPAWVRLVRAGAVVSGYVSSDGLNWVLEDQVSMALPTTVYVGLMVTSHNDGVLTSAVFDNVSVISATGAP